MRTLLAFASTAWIAIPLALFSAPQKAEAQYLQCNNYGFTVQCTGSNGSSLQQNNWSPGYQTIDFNPGYGYGNRRTNCQTYNNGWASQTYCN